MSYFHHVGYCLLPVIGLAGLSILVNLKGLLGVIFATITIAWSTFAAARCVSACICMCVWGVCVCVWF
jgi:protein YIPF5/7